MVSPAVLEFIPDRLTPPIDRGVALGAFGRGHDIPRCDRSAPVRKWNRRPFALPLAEDPVRLLNLGAGESTFEVQIQSREAKITPIGFSLV